MDLLIEHRFTEAIRKCMKMGLLDITINFAKEKIEENTLRMCIDILEMLVDICIEEKEKAKGKLDSTHDRALSQTDNVTPYFTTDCVDVLLELFQGFTSHHNGDVAQHGYHIVDKLVFIKGGRYSISDSEKEPTTTEVKGEIAKHVSRRTGLY